MEMGTGLGTCWLQLPVVMACKALEQVCVYGTLCPVVRGCGMHTGLQTVWLGQALQ